MLFLVLSVVMMEKIAKSLARGGVSPLAVTLWTPRVGEVPLVFAVAVFYTAGQRLPAAFGFFRD